MQPESDPRESPQVDAEYVRRLEAVLRMTGRLAGARSLTGVFESALDGLENALGVSRASILLFDSKGVMTFRAWRDLSDRYRAAVQGHTPWTADDTDAEIISVPDVFEDSSLERYRELFQEERIRSLMFVPLMVSGRVVGKFMLYFRERHEPAEQELEIARAIAGYVALGIQRITSEDERRNTEQRSAVLLEQTSDGIITQDPDGRLTYANQAAATLLGFDSPESLVRTSTAEMMAEFALYDENGAEISAAELPGRMAMTGRQPPPMLVRFKRKEGGEERWSLVSSSPIFRDDGSLRMVLNIFRDVTAWRRAEADREELLTRSRFLAEAGEILASSLEYQTTLRLIAELAVSRIADWVTIDMLREDGKLETLVLTHRDPAKVAWANEMRTRYPTERREARGVYNVLVSGKAELYASITDEMLVASANDNEHLELLRSVGMTSAMVVPLRARGRTLGALTLVSTSRMRVFDRDHLSFAEELARRAALSIDNALLYQRAEEARKDAEHASQTKDEFLATVSHELRTPLTAILGWSRILTVPGVDSETIRAGIESIGRSAEAQTRIVEDLLDVSAIVTGKMHLERRPLRLASIAEGVLPAVQLAADAKQIHLEIEQLEDNVVVLGDQNRLQQVAWNLVSNAIKFTPAGGRITVRVGADGSSGFLEVEDTGIGITADLLPFVFDRFRQADSSTTRSFGGLGLGLSIVKHVTELHGGTATASSDGPGRGSRFRVELPRPPVGNSREARRELSGPLPSLDKCRLLVVDDERESRLMMVTALQRCGAEIRDAGSVADAEAIMSGWRPDLIVSDIAMPGGDGYSLLAGMQRRNELGVIPAIAVTAFGREEDQQRALSAGFDAYLQKPIEPTALVESVAKLLRK